MQNKEKTTIETVNNRQQHSIIIFPRIMMLAILAIYILAVLNNGAIAAEKREGTILPRKVLAVYNGEDDKSHRGTPLHEYFEMPANYLGLDFHYYDINNQDGEELPELGEDYIGVIIWIRDNSRAKHAMKWLKWLNKQLDNKKKIVIIEGFGINDEFYKNKENARYADDFLYRFGISNRHGWHEVTYRASVVSKDKDMVGFERELPAGFPPFPEIIAIEGKAKSHLTIQITEEEEPNTDLVITGENGGYIAPNYVIFEGKTHFSLEENDEEKKKKDNKKQQHRKSNYEKYKKKKYSEIYVNNRGNKEKAADEAEEEEEVSPTYQWYVNPFLFLEKAFGIADYPKPDVTTLNGKRIFYSHIDGDGWNNISEINKYKKTKTLSAEVIQKEILEKYPDIPVAVSVVTAEMDINCYGTKDSRRVAEAIFRLPNIEPSSHTHSHPFEWEYFEDNDVRKEISILYQYPEKLKVEGLYSKLFAEKEHTEWDKYFEQNPEDRQLLDIRKEYRTDLYKIPRAYACEPFSTEMETRKAAEYINSMLPEGKKVRLIQWSGNTSPFEAAIREAREAGLYNINGGDSRYDVEYPSYASVAPIGIRVGKEIQIYSSNSNENTYTNLWTDRFYGFRYLQDTVNNTESPMRVLPFNIYYHMYSGQKRESLLAVKNNLDFARTQNIIPIMTSDYARIANGFYTTKLIKLSPNRWKILDRDTMNTIRFDNALMKKVNIENSEGVLGYNYFQGKLYVHLDPNHSEPIIEIGENRLFGSYPESKRPYLLESNWQIKGLTFVNDLLIIRASGFGDADIKLKMPDSGDYSIAIAEGLKNIAKEYDSTADRMRVKTDKNGILEINIKRNASRSSLTLHVKKHKSEEK